ncbi:MAG: hypothetical protein LAT82_04695 [Nanoarchaeota archaeon]|nr:hypothetical protein [Nanoarchaeota archaeon]
MIPLIHSSLLSKENSITLLQEENCINNSKYIGIVQTISSLKELENKELRHIIKNSFNTLTQKFKNTTFKPVNVCYIDIKEFEFKDKYISIISSLKQEVDYLICCSYSNTTLVQLTSKKCTHLICNVFNQDLVNRFDFIHHFNSGINHVLCNEIKEREAGLGVEMSIFHNISQFKQAKYFSSCIQNSKLATKSKIPHLLFKIIYSITDIRTQKELVLIQKALFKAQSFQIQNQLSFTEEFFEKQERIKRGDLIE